MPRNISPRKLPELDVLARAYLRLGLQRHPEIGKHVSDPNELETMQLTKLLKLSKKMGINAEALVAAVEKEEDQRSNYSFENPGFRGELEFDLTISFQGNAVTRKAKVVYEHTPQWEYFDLRKKQLYEGWESTSYQIEIAAVPQDANEDRSAMVAGKPYWVQLDDITKNDVIPHEMWEALIKAVDEQCRQEDARRRALHTRA